VISAKGLLRGGNKKLQKNYREGLGWGKAALWSISERKIGDCFSKKKKTKTAAVAGDYVL